jgi:hypothetical protein
MKTRTIGAYIAALSVATIFGCGPSKDKYVEYPRQFRGYNLSIKYDDPTHKNAECWIGNYKRSDYTEKNELGFIYVRIREGKIDYYQFLSDAPEDSPLEKYANQESLETLLEGVEQDN